MAQNEFRSWFNKQGAPVTMTLIGSMLASALFFWFARNPNLMLSLGLERGALFEPWRLVTYPWAEMPFTDGLTLLMFAFEMLWIYWMGVPIERDIGSSRFVGLWFAGVFSCSVCFTIGASMSGRAPILLGAELPISVLTMVWCARNMTQVIMLWGIIPLSGKWLAFLTVITTLLIFGNASIQIGVMVILPLIAAYLFGLGRFPALNVRRRPEKESVGRAQSVYGSSYMEEVRKREQERKDRERMRKLFEDSIKDDEK